MKQTRHASILARASARLMTCSGRHSMDWTFGWMTHLRGLVHTLEWCIGVSMAMSYVAWEHSGSQTASARTIQFHKLL
jgi:hypothetical protein